MNNVLFNNVASSLKATFYAEAPNGSSQAVKVDSNQNLLVAGTISVGNSITIANSTLTVTGTVTVSQITNAITIGNTSLTVNGTVTVSEITNPITIGNSSLTVNGTVTVGEITNPITIGNTSLTVNGTITIGNSITISNATLTVGGTVTVGAISGSITIGNSITVANATLTTIVSGYTFTTATVAQTQITGTGELFNNTDISQVKKGTLFIYNGGANTITLSVQISPTTTTGDYVDDPTYTNLAIAGNKSSLIPLATFGKYMRIQYAMNSTTGTITAYFNGQS